MFLRHDPLTHIFKVWDNIVYLSMLHLQYHSKVSWQSIASLNSRFSIPSLIENWESRTSYRESSRGENVVEQETKDSPMADILQTYSCNTTRHGYIRAGDCLLEKRPIQVIKQMFLQGYLYRASFPQVKFQMPAPNASKQCVLVYKQQYVYFVMSNDSGLICHLAW